MDDLYTALVMEPNADDDFRNILEFSHIEWEDIELLADLSFDMGYELTIRREEARK